MLPCLVIAALSALFIAHFCLTQGAVCDFLKLQSVTSEEVA
jgi:hypothetical protein